MKLMASTCPACNGSGQETITEKTGQQVTITCRYCNGKGKV